MTRNHIISPEYHAARYRPGHFDGAEVADVTGEPWTHSPEEVARFSAYADYLPYAEDDEDTQEPGIADRLRRRARTSRTDSGVRPAAGRPVAERWPSVAPESRWQRLSSAGPVIVVTLVGLQRLWAAYVRLPFVYDPTEPWNFLQGQRMVREGVIRPEVYNSPSLIFDLGAAWDWLARHVPILPTIRADTQALGSIEVSGSASFYLLRALVVMLGLVALWCAIGLIRSLVTSGWAQGLSIAVLALGYLQIENAHLFLTGTIGASLLVIALWSLDRFETTQQQRFLTLSLLAATLAACTKYQLFIALALIVVALFRGGELDGVGDPRFVKAAAVAVLAGLVMMPALVLAPGDVAHGLSLLREAYTSTPAGQDSPSVWVNLVALFRSFGLLLPLAALGGFSAWGRERWAIQVSIVYCAVMVLALSVLPAAFTGDLVPLLMPMALLVGLGVDLVVERVRGSGSSSAGTVMKVGLIAAVAPVFISSGFAVSSVASDPRATAREFIDSSLEDGSIIAVEDAAPIMNRKKFAVTQVGSITEQLQPLSNDIDAVVVTSEGSGRVRSTLDEDPAAKYLYERFHDAYCLKHRSGSDGYWAEVYVRCEAK